MGEECKRGFRLNICLYVDDKERVYVVGGGSYETSTEAIVAGVAKAAEARRRKNTVEWRHGQIDGRGPKREGLRTRLQKNGTRSSARWHVYFVSSPVPRDRFSPY